MKAGAVFLDSGNFIAFLDRSERSYPAAVVQKLERLRRRKLTHVDASSLVLLSRLRIRVVWGTDQDLSIEGARVVATGA